MHISKDKSQDLLFRYIFTDPMAQLAALLDIAEKLDRRRLHETQIRVLRAQFSDESDPRHVYAERMFDEVDRRLIAKLVQNFFLNGMIEKEQSLDALKKRYACNIPWAILMDPTNACNLRCPGCPCARSGHRNYLSNETMDRIVAQGKKLNIRFYLFSGGEPLIRRRDLVRLCERNPDCYFLAFTNGTLIDDEFCGELLRVGNFALAFSIEGTEEATDLCRGFGTYQKISEAMARMREHRLLFGYATCQHKYNTDSITSDEFIDEMIARGNRFACNFTYTPIGKDAESLIATPEQRADMQRRMSGIHREKPIFSLDFRNDGAIMNGCVTGEQGCLHIDAAGNIEAYAQRYDGEHFDVSPERSFTFGRKHNFLHNIIIPRSRSSCSDVNIHELTLLEILQRNRVLPQHHRGHPHGKRRD